MNKKFMLRVAGFVIIASAVIVAIAFPNTDMFYQCWAGIAVFLYGCITTPYSGYTR